MPQDEWGGERAFLVTHHYQGRSWSHPGVRPAGGMSEACQRLVPKQAKRAQGSRWSTRWMYDLDPCV